MNEIKPGYKTTEGWKSLIIIASFLLMEYKIITKEDVDALAATIPAIGIITTFVVYVMSRHGLKREAIGGSIVDKIVGMLDEMAGSWPSAALEMETGDTSAVMFHDNIDIVEEK